MPQSGRVLVDFKRLLEGDACRRNYYDSQRIPLRSAVLGANFLSFNGKYLVFEATEVLGPFLDRCFSLLKKYVIHFFIGG